MRAYWTSGRKHVKILKARDVILEGRKRGKNECLRL